MSHVRFSSVWLQSKAVLHSSPIFLPHAASGTPSSKMITTRIMDFTAAFLPSASAHRQGRLRLPTWLPGQAARPGLGLNRAEPPLVTHTGLLSRARETEELKHYR